MQVELKIKETLDSSNSIESKISEICSFMDWDEQKLKDAILKHGTSGKEGRDAIIEEFWGGCSGKKDGKRR